MPTHASYRKKHYCRSEGQTIANQTVVLDTILIPLGTGLILKNLHWQGKAVNQPVTAQSWAHTYATECSLLREGANGLLAQVTLVTRYIGSGPSVTPAAGAVAARANGVDLTVTGVPNGETFTNEPMDWYVEYEVFWAVDDFPE